MKLLRINAKCVVLHLDWIVWWVFYYDSNLKKSVSVQQPCTDLNHAALLFCIFCSYIGRVSCPLLPGHFRSPTSEAPRNALSRYLVRHLGLCMSIALSSSTPILRKGSCLFRHCDKVSGNILKVKFVSLDSTCVPLSYCGKTSMQDS